MDRRILVVEDATDLREELVDYLRFSGFEAVGVGTLAELEQQLKAEPWQVVILDLGLPDGDGLAGAQQIRKTYGLDMGLIMVTARGQVEDRVAGVRHGADAYLVKPIDLRELEAVLEQLLLRLKVVPAPAPTASWSLDLTNQALRTPQGVAIPLTGAETRILARLIANPGQPVARQELCDELGPGGDPEDTRRLDPLISRLRSKVAKRSGESLPVRACRNLGYVVANTKRAIE